MSVLDSIVAGVLEEQKLRQLSSAEIDERIAGIGKVRDPLESLQKRSFSIISEVKRSSPSKGELALIADPAALAAEYVRGGASVISVLTENRRFGGSLEDFTAVRNQVNVPILRKDFIVNEYLVKESRAFGADLLLLIVAALDGKKFPELYALGRQLGMRILVEIHDENELERALEVSPEIVGVNARNLKTLEIDLQTFSRLIPQIPSNIYRVAESGISTIDDVKIAHKAGADAILVGESLVKSGVPSSTIAEFLSVGKV